MPKKILIFAPFGDFRVHHQFDAVLGAALMQRGCEVKALLCDGLMKQCYLAGNPTNAQFCANCANCSTQLFGALGIPITQIRSLLSDKDHGDAHAWAQSVDPMKFKTELFEGHPIGQWMAFGVYQYFRTSNIDLNRAEHVSLYRNMLVNGALIKRALDRLYETFAPDHLICYQGAHSFYRVCAEIVRERGAKILIHERGHSESSFILVNNRTTYEISLDGFHEWEQWSRAPLKAEQLQKLKTNLVARQGGRKLDIIADTNFETSDVTIRPTLGIPAGAPIVALFSSGDWEVGILEGYGRFRLAFDSQAEWIRAVSDYCAQRGYYLVVRHHPLGAGTKIYPRATDFISAMLKVNRSLPPHVRVVMPAEKISSYDLIWNAEASISIFSTTSAESVVSGLSSVSTAPSLYQPMGVALLKDKQNLAAALDAAVAKTRDFGIDDLRTAYRYLHFLQYIAFSNLFKTVGIKNQYQVDIRIQALEELREGNDLALDRVCRHILEGGPLYESPPETDGREEQEFLEKELASIKVRREKVNRTTVPQSGVGSARIKVISAAVGSTAVQDRVYLPLSLKRQRVMCHDLCEITAPDTSTALQEILGKLNGEHTYVYLAPPHSQLDDCAFSKAIETLSRPEHQGAEGVILGAYFCDQNEHLVEELATHREDAPESTTQSFRKTLTRIPLLGEPLHMLSLAVFKRESLEALLRGLLEGAASQENMLFTIFHHLFSSPARFVPLNMPCVTLYTPASWNGATQIVTAPVELDHNAILEMSRQALDALREGRNENALTLLMQVIPHATDPEPLLYAQAVVEYRLGLVDSARRSLQSVLTKNPAHTPAQELLNLLG